MGLKVPTGPAKGKLICGETTSRRLTVAKVFGKTFSIPSGWENTCWKTTLCGVKGCKKCAEHCPGHNSRQSQVCGDRGNAAGLNRSHGLCRKPYGHSGKCS